MNEPIEVVVPVAKFRDYIFKEGATHGKAAVFHRLGYYKEHSEALATVYEEQGARKFLANEFVAGTKDEFGQRIIIEIELPGIGDAKGQKSLVKAGWLIRADGRLTLSTPFTGFGKTQTEGKSNENPT